MAERPRNKNIREALILAGVNEIKAHGVGGFSIRQVAEACGVSCAAPYRHFKDKKEFIAAIIAYVNGQWQERQQQVLEECGEGLREKIVAISVDYVKFLMEKPHYRAVLMLKDEEFDNIYHKIRGQNSSRSQILADEYFSAAGIDGKARARKLYVVRALIFGAVVMFDNGEMEYNDQTLEQIRFCIDREFDLP